MRRSFTVMLAITAATLLSGCGGTSSVADSVFEPAAVEKPRIEAVSSEPVRKILENAERQIEVTRNYTQDYFNITYPNGDVPAETGACTDVVIRAFRAAGVDLQQEVHEDMKPNFAAYPQKWGLKKTDTNIDHRRVPNLETFFTRRGLALPVIDVDENHRPGDVVSWDLNGKGMTHIGLVSNFRNEQTGRYLIIHNIGGGTKMEDRLFEWKITGHFRYFQ